jgi:hypothetical protein
VVLEPIRDFVVEQLICAFPRWVVRRIAPPAQVASEVEIDLCRPNPVDVQYGAAIPYLGLGFRVTNLSRVSLTLDRMLLEVWFGQPTVKGHVLEPKVIPARRSEFVYFREQLDVPQQEQIRKQANGKVIELVAVYVDAHFLSVSGPVHVKAMLEHRDLFCKSL